LNPDLVRAARVSGILAGEDIFSWGMVPSSGAEKTPERRKK
jgi:hypothetical protein